MGGKRNQANRTKGNARPSSSGRTAEKLATGGNILPNFVGFGGFVVDPAQGSDEHINVNITADLRLAIKKMTKKDVTTKLKAIQEFTDSCQKRSSEEIKAMLSSWPRLFNKLSMDHDRRVREALFQAHEQVVIQTRKNLAPYLRNIMGSWIIAQCDTYAPAASAAQSSFKAAFPPTKQAEAVAFCKTEVIGLIEDNLFHQTARTLSDPETTPVEEMEAKYIRIITSSFLAWKHILTVMPKSEHEALMENYTKMFSESKFWKFAKHESPLIRSAWFSLISTTSQVLPSALNEKKLCPLVLGSLDDSDATVSPVVWEAAMYTLVTFDNCWNHVNARKVVLPKLWTVLQDGGNGNASVIYPNLLPFLNKIPAQVMGDPMQFYSEFFARMRKGLSAPRIQSSQSEIASIIKAYMECLKFIASKHWDDEDIKIEYLIADQLLPVLESSLKEKSSKIKLTNFYELFMDLLQHWHKNAEKIHMFVLKQFELTCKEVLEMENETYAVSQLAEMFGCLLGKSKQKKGLRVQFVDAVEENEDMPFLEIILPSYLSDDGHPFFIVLCNVCTFALQVARKTNSMPHFKFLASIASCYSNSKFLFHLTKKEVNTDELHAGKIFFHEIVLPWLSIDSIKSEKEFPEHFINLALAAYSCADSESKFEILNNLCQAQYPEIIEQLLYKAEYFCYDKTFMKWLKSEAFESTLQELTRQLCTVTTSQASPNTDVVWRVLSCSFSTGANLEPLVSSTCLGQILNIFQQALSRESLHLEPSLQFVCNLASKLFINFKECWSITSTSELLVTMFSTTCQPPSSLSANILCQVESTWLLGIDSFACLSDGLKPGGFFHQASKVIQNAILSKNVTEKCLNNLVETTWKLLSALNRRIAQNENSAEDREFFVEIFNLFLPSNSTWQRLRQQIGNEWKVNAALEDALVFIHAEIPEELSPRTENLSFIPMASFVGQILMKKYTGKEKNPLRSAMPSLVDQMKEILYAVAYCELSESVERKKNYNEIASYVLTTICTQLPTIIGEMESGDAQRVIKELEDLSKTEGYLWSLGFNKMTQIAPNLCSKKLELFDWNEDCKEGDTPPSFHSVFVSQKYFYPNLESNPLITMMDSKAEYTISDLTRWIAISRKQLQFCVDADSDAQNFVKIVLELFTTWRDEKSELLLFAREFAPSNWCAVTLNVEIFKFLSVSISKFGRTFDSKHWDFILCGLCLWLQSCVDNEKNVLSKPSTLFYMYECFNFFRVTRDFITNGGQNVENHPELVTEWREFFSDGLFQILLRLLVSISGTKASNAKLADIENKLILSLTLALEKIPVKSLEKNQLPKLKIEQDSEIPDDLQKLLAHVLPLLSSSIRPVQITAYQILKRVISTIAKHAENRIFADDIAENSRYLPTALKTLLTDMTAIVNSYFAEMGTSEGTINLQPDSTVFSYMMCYLLAWDAVLELLSSVSSELRSEYSEFLHSSGLMPDLLANLFYLIPENATLGNFSRMTAEGSVSKTMFSVKPPLELWDTSSASELKHVACQVYFEAIKKLPALVRQWWNNQDKQMLSLVERITSKYVSTIILTEELQAVQNSGKNFGNMTIRASVKTQEVLAVYTIDEVSMELIIKLAPNHPLGRVNVECVRRIGVGHTQWRNWMLQLNTFLMYQNGSILDGLSLWKRNIDKKFEGIEECYICFYVLHGSNCQLPRLVCRTCKKKFHSACLYKWFSTSNQSTCPLCRNLF